MFQALSFAYRQPVAPVTKSSQSSSGDVGQESDIDEPILVDEEADVGTEDETGPEADADVYLPPSTPLPPRPSSSAPYTVPYTVRVPVQQWRSTKPIRCSDSETGIFIGTGARFGPDKLHQANITQTDNHGHGQDDFDFAGHRAEKNGKVNYSEPEVPKRIAINTHTLTLSLQSVTGEKINCNSNTWIRPFKYLLVYEPEIREFHSSLCRYVNRQNHHETTNSGSLLQVSEDEEHAAAADNISKKAREIPIDTKHHQDMGAVISAGADSDSHEPSDDKSKHEPHASPRTNGESATNVEADIYHTDVSDDDAKDPNNNNASAFEETSLTDAQYDKVSRALLSADVDSLVLKEAWDKLIDFMDKDIGDIMSLRRSIADGTLVEIHFEDLWHLFNPGDVVITRQASESDQWRAYKVLHVTGGRPIIDEPNNSGCDSLPSIGYQEDLDRDRNEVLGLSKKVTPFVIDCFYIDFDGYKYGPRPRRFVIQEYPGQRAITSLDAFPAKFCKDGNVREALVDRGQRFVQVARQSHKQYAGPTHPDRWLGNNQNEVCHHSSLSVRSADVDRSIPKSSLTSSWERHPFRRATRTGAWILAVVSSRTLRSPIFESALKLIDATRKDVLRAQMCTLMQS